MADFALTPPEEPEEDPKELAADAAARKRLARVLATRTPEQLLETQRRVRLMHQLHRDRARLELHGEQLGLHDSPEVP